MGSASCHRHRACNRALSTDVCQPGLASAVAGTVWQRALVSPASLAMNIAALQQVGQ